jgi:hypothetical protein
MKIKFFLVIFLLFLSSFSRIDYNTNNYQKPSINLPIINKITNNSELKFYSNYTTISTPDFTSIPALIIPIGLFYGQNVYYFLVAHLSENSSVSIKFFLQRNLESYYFILEPGSSWEAIISFKDCCKDILQQTNIFFEANFLNIIPNNSIYEFLVYYSFYKYPISGIPDPANSTSLNALGFPFPPRTFIVGLMILIIGIIPIAIFDLILTKLSKRNKNTNNFNKKKKITDLKF